MDISVKKEVKVKATKEKKPKHNSLQHDDTVGAPLLEVLINKINTVTHTEILEAAKRVQKKDISEKVKKKQVKEEADEESESIDSVADEIIEITDDEKDVDAVALADQIKKLYAGEIQEMAYKQGVASSYNAASAYAKANSVKLNSAMYNSQYSEKGSDVSSSEAQNNGANRMKDENSKAYRLSSGSKMQAYAMTDPKGRLHNRWNLVRSLNESADGKFEINNGLHYQGLS